MGNIFIGQLKWYFNFFVLNNVIIFGSWHAWILWHTLMMTTWGCLDLDLTKEWGQKKTHISYENSMLFKMAGFSFLSFFFTKEPLNKLKAKIPNGKSRMWETTGIEELKFSHFSPFLSPERMFRTRCPNYESCIVISRCIPWLHIFFEKHMFGW